MGRQIVSWADEIKKLAGVHVTAANTGLGCLAEYGSHLCPAVGAVRLMIIMVVITISAVVSNGSHSKSLPCASVAYVRKDRLDSTFAITVLQRSQRFAGIFFEYRISRTSPSILRHSATPGKHCWVGSKIYHHDSFNLH